MRETKGKKYGKGKDITQIYSFLLEIFSVKYADFGLASIIYGLTNHFSIYCH